MKVTKQLENEAKMEVHRDKRGWYRTYVLVGDGTVILERNDYMYKKTSAEESADAIEDFANGDYDLAEAIEKYDSTEIDTAEENDEWDTYEHYGHLVASARLGEGKVEVTTDYLDKI